jgi:hypothetical protein
MDTLFGTFRDPPTEYGIIPLWFWNDDLEEAELMRQLHEFHRAGFGGVIPHPRVGLSPMVGYLTERYFYLVRLVVEECARLGMKVILYDEGCYPSGSANGAVIKENPEYASQCIGLIQKDVMGPWFGFWKPDTGGRSLMDRHVCTVAGQLTPDGKIDTSTLLLLKAEPHDIIRLDLPEGRWKVMSVWNACSAGHIRGVLADEETGHATAPPSGDILNPDAVACFLRLTHDRYSRHLKDYFGSTSMTQSRSLLVSSTGCRIVGRQIPAPGCHLFGLTTAPVRTHFANAIRKRFMSGSVLSSMELSRNGAASMALH